jgi:hypothetical protein
MGREHIGTWGKMREVLEEVRQKKRFDFGNNWDCFLQLLDEDRITLVQIRF